MQGQRGLTLNKPNAAAMWIMLLSWVKSCKGDSKRARTCRDGFEHTTNILSPPRGNVMRDPSRVELVLVSSSTGESVSRAMSSLTYPTPEDGPYD